MNRIAIQCIIIVKMIIDILQAMASQLLVYCSLWGPISGTGLNWFHAKYMRSKLLHHPFALRELYVIALFYIIYLLY